MSGLGLMVLGLMEKSVGAGADESARGGAELCDVGVESAVADAVGQGAGGCRAPVLVAVFAGAFILECAGDGWCAELDPGDADVEHGCEA